MAQLVALSIRDGKVAGLSHDRAMRESTSNGIEVKAGRRTRVCVGFSQ